MKRLLPIFISLAMLPSPVHAWGRKGHAAIADIAAANLTPTAQAQVSNLLKDDLDAAGRPSGRSTLAEIASWADEIRDAAPKDTYRGWHTRGNPVCSETLSSCKRGDCVDQKIAEYTAILRDNSQPHRARNEALKWIIHLIGDLHMPLHSGSNQDRAGQDIQVRLIGLRTNRNATLHTVWDGELAILALKKWPPPDKPEPLLWADDTPEEWMREARLIAHQYVYQPLPGFVCGQVFNSPVELDTNYQQQAIPVIREQMTKAGLRLARWLNQILQ